MVDAHARWLVASSAIALVAVASFVLLPPRAPFAARLAGLPDRWRALFLLVLATQAGHVGEYVAQMIQLHVLSLPATQSRGILGQFDLEWVHFGWSLYILAASAVLLRRFPWNRWLALTVFLAVWHELEHATILTAYLQTGVIGAPGLVARGGLLAGGLPIARADLHFLYNAMISAPLLLAFRAETLRRVRAVAFSWGTA